MSVLYDVVGLTYDVVGWQESRCLPSYVINGIREMQPGRMRELLAHVIIASHNHRFARVQQIPATVSLDDPLDPLSDWSGDPEPHETFQQYTFIDAAVQIPPPPHAAPPPPPPPPAAEAAPPPPAAAAAEEEEEEEEDEPHEQEAREPGLPAGGQRPRRFVVNRRRDLVVKVSQAVIDNHTNIRKTIAKGNAKRGKAKSSGR